MVLLPLFFIQLTGTSAPWFASIMGGLSEAISAITKLLSGLISDHIFTRKPLIVLGYGLGAIFNGLIAFSTSAWQIIACQAFYRIGKGLRDPARDALLSVSVKPAYYGRSFGFNRAMDTVGAIIGPLFVIILLPYVTVHTLIACSSLAGILAVLSILLLVKEVASPSKKPRLFNNSFSSLFKQLPRSFIFFLIVWFIFCCGNVYIMLFILRAQEILQLSTTSLLSVENISIGLYILFNIIQAISEFALGRVSDVGGRKHMLNSIGFAIFGISCILWGLATSFMGIASAFILSGISIAATEVLSKSYTAELLPAHIRGAGYGILQATNGCAKLIAGLVIGTLWTQLSPLVAFSYAATMSFIATLLFLIPVNVDKNIQKPAT